MIILVSCSQSSKQKSQDQSNKIDRISDTDILKTLAEISWPVIDEKVPDAHQIKSREKFSKLKSFDTFLQLEKAIIDEEVLGDFASKKGDTIIMVDPKRIINDNVSISIYAGGTDIHFLVSDTVIKMYQIDYNIAPFSEENRIKLMNILLKLK